MLFGLALGMLSIVKLLDMGFFAVLARPFDPLLDWQLLDDAMTVLAGSIGALPAIGALAVAVTISTALIIYVTRSVQHLSRLVVRHNATAARAVVVLAVTWLTCAMFAIQIVPGVPIAVEASALYLHTRAHLAGTGAQDRQSVSTDAGADAFENTPATDLLTALEGKDVIVAFVESYGRDAVEDPEFASPVGCCARRWRSSTRGGRIRVPECLSDLTDRRGQQLARARHLAFRLMDRQPAALRRPSFQPPVDPHQRLQPRGMAHGRRHARQRLSLARKRVPRLPPGLWRRGDGVSGPPIQLGHHARPVHPVQVRTHRALSSGPPTSDGRDHTGLEPRALGAHPTTRRLERRR